VPDIALVDPQLARDCPKTITAQSGMDAFTQLVESYLSPNASAITDALAVDGIRNIREGLVAAVENGDNLAARERMANASMLSGITLTNAGLGTVHGFASSVGGYFDIPHGLICARMMLPVNLLTISKLKGTKDHQVALSKYARIGKLFSLDKKASDAYYVDRFLDVLTEYTDKLKIKGLAEFGLKSNNLKVIVGKTGNKYNPIALDNDEMLESLRMAL
jgi:alcohol dehydrogenase class IV